MNRIDEQQFLRLICGCEKPGRYTGGELNQIVKESALVRMAVSYPDLYEVGMANNGIRILYDVANALPEVACERVFAVTHEFEHRLRDLNMPLFTLETRTILRELDLIGFNLSHEMLYTNVLQILDLGGIPLFRKDRKDGDPIIVGGGEAVSNPAPAMDFFDVIFIGDGEEGLRDMLLCVQKGKEEALSREEVLKRMGSVEGVLLPHLYGYRYNSGRLEGVEGPVVKRRVYRGSEPVIPEKPLVPGFRIVQERAVVDVTRGCDNLCNFCHAGYYDLPYRSYGIAGLRDKIFRILDNTGYSELSLGSLSISDYRDLVPFINTVLPDLTRRGVSISLPSLRVDRSTIEILEHISDVRKSSLTFAIESASEEMRRIANKMLDVEDLIEIVEYIIERGWRQIKLYFMIGLPGCEAHNEAEAIVALLRRILQAGRKRLGINVTVSPFIPKPHTPFQRRKQMGLDYLQETVLAIKKGLPRSVSVKNHNLRASLLEGIISRGDSRIGEVIHRVYMAGCRHDSWKEHFRFDVWKDVLDESLPGWELYLDERTPEEALPWGMVKTGFETLIAAKTTCGSGASKETIRRRKTAELDKDALDAAFREFEKKYHVASRIRIAVTKQDSARFISHIELVDVMKRALRMGNVPVSFTQGFNKRERISAGYPLPLGLESIAEIFDIDLYEDIDCSAVMERIQQHLPDGMTVRSLQYLGSNDTDSLMKIVQGMSYRVTFDNTLLHEKFLEGCREQKVLVKHTKKGPREIAFSDAVIRIEDSGNSILVTIAVGDDSSMRIDDMVMQLTGTDREGICSVMICRENQFILSEGELRAIV